MSSRLSGIFNEALAIEDAAEQEAYLQEACGDDPALLARAKELLDASRESNDSLFRPFATLPKEDDHLHETEEIKLPREFGNYRLEEKIGEGGMGVIYRAVQLDLQRVVALKMVRNAQLATQSEIKRFYTEARSAAALNHPGIVPVIESGKVGEQHFFSMGFVDGINLAMLQKESAISMEQVVHLAKEIATATQYAHEKGVVHRDLKPENILISFRDSEPDAPDHFQAHISDFGLAKRQEHDPGLTIAGEILGTPGYMSPEQALGNSEVNESTDVYAIGALLYFMLTKRAPFKGDSVWDTMEKVRQSEPARPTSIRPFIPEELETITLKCLEKEPRHRYSSAGDILSDLENHQGGRPLIAKPSGPVLRIAKFCRRNPVLTLSGILGIFLVASLIFFPLKLKLSAAKLAKENAATEAAKKQVAQQKAHSELTRATQSVSTGSHRQAIMGFLSAAELAKKADDPQAEESARWGVSDSFSRLWAKTGSLFSLPGVTKMALSPDGRHLAVISIIEDGATSSTQHGLEVFDTKTQQSLFQKVGETTYKDISFHPSGNSLIVSTGQEGLSFLEKTGPRFTLRNSFEAKDKDIKPTTHHSIGFLKDGNSFFASGKVPRIGVWDFNAPHLFRGIIQADGHLNTAAISGIGSKIAACSMHDNLFCWNPMSREKIFGPINIGLIASQIAVNHEGTQLALISEKEDLCRLYNISNWDLKTTAPSSFQIIEQSAPGQIQFGEKTGALFYLSKTGSLRVKENSSTRDQAVPISRKDVKAFAVSKNESFLVTAHRDSNELIIWKTSPFWGNQFTLPESSHRRYHSSGSDQTMMIGGLYDVRVFPSAREQLASEDLLPELVAQDVTGVPLDILGSHSAEFVFVLGRHKGSLHVRRITKDRKYHAWSIPIPLEEPVEMIFGPNEKRLVCFSKNLSEDKQDNVTVIDTEAKNLQSYSIPNISINAATLSTLRNDEVIFVSEPGSLTWFNLDSGTVNREYSIRQKDIVSMISSSEQGAFALGLQNGEIHLYDEESLSLKRTFLHDESASLLSFGNRGQLLIAGGNEDFVKIWEVATGLTIGNNLVHQGKIVDLDVCDASKSIITATANGQVKVWPIPTKDEREIEAIREEALRLLLITE